MQIDSTGGLQPQELRVNGQPCAFVGLPPQVTQAPPTGAKAESASKLTTKDGQIIGLDGKPLFLTGINYFGFETGNTFLDGFWIGMHPPSPTSRACR